MRNAESGGRRGQAAQDTGFIASVECVPVRDRDGTAPAGLSVSMPGVRYEPRRLQALVATLEAAAHALEDDLSDGT